MSRSGPPERAPRGDRSNADDAVVAVEAGDRDRKPHAEGVNRPAAREQHAAPGFQIVSTEKAAAALGEGLRDLHREPGCRQEKLSVLHERGTIAPANDARACI